MCDQICTLHVISPKQINDDSGVICYLLCLKRHKKNWKTNENGKLLTVVSFHIIKTPYKNKRKISLAKKYLFLKNQFQTNQRKKKVCMLCMIMIALILGRIMSIMSYV